MYGIVMVGTRNCQAYNLSKQRNSNHQTNGQHEAYSYAIKRILIPAILGQDDLETRLNDELTENEQNELVELYQLNTEYS